MLEERETSRDTTRLAERQIDFPVSKLRARPPVRKATSITVVVLGRLEQVVELELGVHEVAIHVEAAEGHFLVAQKGDTFRHLITTGAYTEEMGETGQVLAAVDIDADGTDELIVEWRYSEGRWYRLVKRAGDRLIVLGEFGIGS